MRPLILITNDDGVYSPGLAAAAEAVQHLGDLLIVAPRFQQTSMGRSFPKGNDVGKIEKIQLVINNTETDAFGVYGSPAHAISYGVLELASKKPDLCISGINYGENLGLSLTCSGTVGAAFEADSYDIPSIAVSRQAPLAIQHASDYIDMDWKISKKITTDLAYTVLKNGLSKEISILNVNIPNEATNNTEIRITKQSRLNYSIFQKPESRDFSSGYTLKSVLDIDITKVEQKSDIYAFYVDKVISITPLTWNFTDKSNWEFS